MCLLTGSLLGPAVPLPQLPEELGLQDCTAMPGSILNAYPG